VVPGGGIAPDGEHWIACRPGFFLPVRVLSRLFRRLFLDHLHEAFHAGQLRFDGQFEPLRQADAFRAYLAPTAQAEWVVYAKPPFGGLRQVLNYLGRYTHRVAISNNRLIKLEERRLTFSWKDYKHEPAQRTMTLDADEFIRRFLLHVLPNGLQHIRHYGFLANRYRQTKLVLCRQLLRAPALPPPVQESSAKEDYRDLYLRLTGKSLRDCPICGKGHMVYIETFAAGSLVHARSPPLAVMLPAFPLIESRHDRSCAFRPALPSARTRRTVNLRCAVGCILCRTAVRSRECDNARCPHLFCPLRPR
jgi:hypothetical protein